ncbi:Triosephosphate isomerase [Annulohypoxylon maeteangense]|uniref:Triosephosphate isomerase n=1 Tax=Annulohypoxylon maeteangense TaxID=1927788 RepID=UPI00200796CB|nr:Triosephosphate isomerase [Annulohypoxylon maeteangense]KAI0880618.1 Triosephosphate isomerase [Annulohypoxylon maeteangense]
MTSHPSPPRRRIVGVSTKMYFSAARTRQYVHELLQIISSSPTPPGLLDQLDVFVIPDHVTLMSVVSQLEGTNILTGAQDAFYEDTGAYTGEVSPAVLAEVGCRIVELGHAERRRIFGETDLDAARKAAAAARYGMIPLVCIGERAREGEGTAAATTAAIDECKLQVEAVLESLPDDAEIVLAYEPVWAIGAAEPAGAQHVVAVTREIRALECVRRRRGTTRIMYGGSAGPGLFEKLKDGVDGLFLGRFAHDPAQFYRTILEIAAT